jgi:hypothetical protein
VAKPKKIARKQAGRGRPPGRKPLLALRIDQPLYDRLVDASEAAQISLAEETVTRIKRSFTEEAIFGGPEVRHIAILMIVSFYSAGQLAAAANGHSDWSARKWLQDKDCFRSAMISVMSALMDLHSGDLQEKLMIYESLKGRAATRFANSSAAATDRTG